ncbi:MAG: Mur ligase family protein, partial [Angustibacter sp.]
TCAIEVSSQALAQHRLAGTQLSLAGFSNFSQDHLELHGDLGSYLAAKQLLLTPDYTQAAVVIVDDPGSRTAAAQAGVPVTTISAESDQADWRIRRVRARARGHDFELLGGGERHVLHCPLAGEFNVFNAALAAVMLEQSGYPMPDIARGLERAPGVPGRMERIGAQVSVIVDYAHTPQAVRAAVRALRPTAPARLIVVLGAGGDRDRAKRPLMGAAAAEADVLILTDDNPRSEDPAQIRAAVQVGARGGRATIVEIPDRAAAIRAAVAELADPRDVVLVAGKGHEQGQEVRGQIWPFDDRVEVAAALSEAGMS